jgi:exopolysaccharide biosynthesis polyprenyl glycosylphosphotransferase
MLKRNARALDLAVRTLDVAGLTLALPIAHALRMRFDTLAPLEPLGQYWPLLARTLFLWVAVAWLTEVYGAYRKRPLTAEIFRLGRAILLTAAGLATLAYLEKHHISRVFVSLYMVVAFAWLASSRIAIRSVARAIRRRGYNTRRYAVVGSGPLAREIVRTMGAHPEWGYEFAGFVVDGPAPAALARDKVLGSLDDFERLLRSTVLDEVTFVVSRERLSAVERMVLACEEQGISTRVCMDLFATRIATRSVEDLDGIPLLTLSTTPSDSLALAAKRAFDLFEAAVALLVLSPIFLVVAVAIRLESPGPIFFRQRRVGVYGREFNLYKFRSMYQDAEARLESLRARNEVSGPVFKMRDDPRVTRVGRFIRRASIDELPQFWNVLRGEMSVVGPRPPLPSEVKQYERWQHRRHSVKPRITCTWQVSGRSQISFEQWMELDLRYIDSWSLWQDVKILARTIPAVLTGRGAQ